jgi:KUP system potassium uptake protein
MVASEEYACPAHEGQETERKISSSLMLGALGVVYGDIGTSPLYAFKQTVLMAGDTSAQTIIALLSLIIWSLLLVVTFKYVLIIMQANNRGEGGTLALTALAISCLNHPAWRWFVLMLGLVGASLFYGDSMITPAISVLSAVEGIEIATPLLKPYVIPVTLVLITALFALERHGTATIGGLFGPVMLLWFGVIGCLGLFSIIQNPAVMQAFDPSHGLSYLFNHPLLASSVLGAVVLAVTGGEALYADMGHFGIGPIRRIWLFFVLPCLLLNYLGQGALLLRTTDAIANPFYQLAPDWALFPMVILSSLATIIASQAVISGAFSITNQAIQLGFVPRIRVRHTSSDEIGQIYVSKVNIFLFFSVIGLVLLFETSDNLAVAYGVAVTGTMTVVTLLAYLVMVRKLHWRIWIALPIFSIFIFMDLGFFLSNIKKFLHGGWVPLLIAGLIFLVMLAWVQGRERLLASRWQDAMPLNDFIAGLQASNLQRVSGTAVFMVPNMKVVPSTLSHALKHFHVLHEQVILMTVTTTSSPYVRDKERMELYTLGHGITLVKLHYGFFEEPRILRVLARLRLKGYRFHLSDVSFFVGRERIVTQARNPLKRLRDKLFILLHRNMLSATDYYEIPPDRVVELGGYCILKET